MCPETEKGIFDAILEGEIDFESSPWPSISHSAKDLVRKMLTMDPKKRISSAQVLGNFCYRFRSHITRCILHLAHGCICPVYVVIKIL